MRPMAYRASAQEPKTAWARHLDQVRRARGMSATAMFETVGPDLGLGPKSRSAFLPFLVDKDPDEAEAAILARHFGWPPAELQTQKVGATPSGDALADALKAIAEELRLAREERAATERRLAYLEAVISRLVGPRDPDPALEGEAEMATDRMSERRLHPLPDPAP